MKKILLTLQTDLSLAHTREIGAAQKELNTRFVQVVVDDQSNEEYQYRIHYVLQSYQNLEKPLFPPIIPKSDYTITINFMRGQGLSTIFEVDEEYETDD